MNQTDFPKAYSPYALVAITRHGCKLAIEISKKLHSDLKAVDYYFPEKFRTELENDITAQYYDGKVKDVLDAGFSQYRGIIAIVSLGALIRLMAPLLQDKTKDPAVVVIDEKGEYVISVLSGHIGGGNDLARQLADQIGAKAVITTSSDVQKTLSVDLLGKTLGWEMESTEHITSISAAVVNDEPVAIIQESGEKNWWPYNTSLPKNLRIYQSIQDASDSSSEHFIFITHRELIDNPDFDLIKNKKIILFRPKVIGIGLGCNRNTSEEEIQSVVFGTLRDLKISLRSLRGVGSIDLKSNEPGLLSFCNKNKWPIVFYSASQLNSVKIENPSETVFKHTGAYAVSEPAAKILTGNDNLLLVKKISGNVTISVGLFHF